MDDAQETSLTIVRRIKAPIKSVYLAWTDAQELRRWMAPADKMVVALAECDPRVGGRYRIVMREGDGTEHRVGGAYREVVTDKRLVFTWAWESSPERQSLVAVEFKSMGEETELKLTHSRFADTPARDRHREGWAGCLDMLERRFSPNSERKSA
jgi:uncharacterized protein YndB with AHSA1/START domain